MDEAEKCTDIAYINAGKLLYSGTTKNLIPFSKVKSYIVNASNKSFEQLNTALKTYPKILVSLVNNDLRISSPNHAVLDKFIEEQKAYVFTEVPPTFEEVFIGLMR